MKLCQLFVIPLCLLLFLHTDITVAQSTQDKLDESLGTSKDDFAEMLERRQIRVLVVYNKLMYFLDGPTQRGITYEIFDQFRQFIDKKYKFGSRRFNVVYLPVTRDQLIPMLLAGRGDVAEANLSITPQRLEQVAFSDPLGGGVREILVTGPNAPEIKTREDLSGKSIRVRKSSSYYNSLENLNREFAERGLDPLDVIAADEYLEDSDLLEMANVGLLDMVVVDSHKAKFWKDVFTNITVRDDIALSQDQQIGIAFRKDSPELAGVLNEFVGTIKKGTLTGNILLKRYYKNNRWVKNPLDSEDEKRLQGMIHLFRNYGDRYDFDWLMLAALGYQESGLDQSVRSAAGAIGVMQVLPSTASDPNVGVPDVHNLEDNIHAGSKYLRFLRDRYFGSDEIDAVNGMLLTFASYNAGPARIAGLRQEAGEEGLDPNVWFGNVEHIVARRVGRETVQYVSNIYKYYIAYKLLSDQSQRKSTGDKEAGD